jgi:hypothetical protein
MKHSYKTYTPFVIEFATMNIICILNNIMHDLLEISNEM